MVVVVMLMLRHQNEWWPLLNGAPLCPELQLMQQQLLLLLSWCTDAAAAEAQRRPHRHRGGVVVVDVGRMTEDD